jgi:hypothetical protein
MQTAREEMDEPYEDAMGASKATRRSHCHGWQVHKCWPGKY